MRGCGGRSLAAILAFAVACTTSPFDRVRQPLSAGLVALSSGDYGKAERRLTEAALRYPILEDYSLYFRARTAARAGRPLEGLEATRLLLERHPDSTWARRTYLLSGELLRAGGYPAAARTWFEAARGLWPPGCGYWARASLELAEVEVTLGEPERALDLTTEVRQECPRRFTGGRARRIVHRVRAEHPELPPLDPLVDAELRVREGDATGARDLADEILTSGERSPTERARALWTRAQAERALGDRGAAEATSLTLARELPDDPLAARALLATATGRWNADDDVGALALFRDIVTRFPSRPQAADARYAIGRIHQEAGAYDAASRAYMELVDHHPTSALADEARWRAAWVRYLAGDLSGAEKSFARRPEETRASLRASSDYWRARAIERLGRTDEARVDYARIVERYPSSYYADLAERRLGHSPEPVAPPASAPVSFPADLTGPHADRARLLAQLGHARFARREVAALQADHALSVRVLEAYRAIGAPAPALRLARTLDAQGTPGLEHYLYPLGYWDAVRPAAAARGVDPLLVVSLMRQESLFEPAAVSSADARGVMQLLPSTARELSSTLGTPPPSRASLHEVPTNVTLGVALLGRLLDRFGGSREKALAAYNAGDQAIAKWERRYPDRDADEFVELISYRETRDYVKAVLGNYRAYRTIYAAPPNASASSVGKPPNAPFDITASTSPGRAVSTR